MFIDGRSLQTRRWKKGWNYDENGLIYVRQGGYLGKEWQVAVLQQLDAKNASGPVRRAAFVDLIRGMAGQITPEVIFGRMERHLHAQHDGNPHWNDPLQPQ